MSKPIVVYIRSLAYSGTTWVNLVLGCHPDAFALGVPDRIWTGGADVAERLCSVDGAACEFWPRYFEHWRGEKNAMSLLAEVARARVILLNNINMNLLNEQVAKDDVDLRYMVVLRDGRANVTSALRHTPELFHDRYHAMRTWLKPAWENLFNGLPRDESRLLVIKYEDMVHTPTETIARIGDFLDLDYGADAFRYWEHEHHYIGGNTGTMGLLRDMRGLPRAKHARESYYQELANATRARPLIPVLDESWQEYLTREDLVAYDYLCGELHEAMGYVRDEIGIDESTQYVTSNHLPENAAQAPESIAGVGPNPRWRPVPPRRLGLMSRLRSLLGL